MKDGHLENSFPADALQSANGYTLECDTFEPYLYTVPGVLEGEIRACEQMAFGGPRRKSLFVLESGPTSQEKAFIETKFRDTDYDDYYR